MLQYCLREMLQNFLRHAPGVPGNRWFFIPLRKVAEDKAQWIASSPAMHDVARRMLGSTLGNGLYSARCLGLDHSLRQAKVKGGKAVRKQRDTVSSCGVNSSSD
jgi:hypothetical protein